MEVDYLQRALEDSSSGDHRPKEEKKGKEKEKISQDSGLFMNQLNAQLKKIKMDELTL